MPFINRPHEDATEEPESEEIRNPEEALNGKRTCTDKICLFGMIIYFLLLFVFLGLSITNLDLDHLVNGFDHCGNICGKNNIKTDSSPTCFGKDMRDKKYLLIKIEEIFEIKILTLTCVSNCIDYDAHTDFSNRCFSNSEQEMEKKEISEIEIVFNEIHHEMERNEDLYQSWKYLLALSIIPIIICFIIMLLLRYATAFLVWFVIICMPVTVIACFIYFWVFYSQAKNVNKEESTLFYSLAIGFSVTTIIPLYKTLASTLAGRIKLIIQLFKEAAKVIAAIPLLLFQSILTSLVFVILVIFCVYIIFAITFSGHLTAAFSFDENETPEEFQLYVYTLSTLQNFTIYYSAIAGLWIALFVIACQEMVIAGCVARWYFTRNKDNLKSPICATARILIRYHLGTVALGSLFIFIVELIKSYIEFLLKKAQKYRTFLMKRICCVCWFILQCLETILKYFTRNTYIMTAIYGYPFCTSGKRATRLLLKNIFNVIAIKSIGGYIIYFMMFFVIAISVLVDMQLLLRYAQIKHFWMPLTFLTVLAFFISCGFFSVLEMAIDTIVLCFCEDCEINDGYSKPYYMSRNLMEFIENSNKTVNSKYWTNTQEEAWRNGPKRIIMLESS